MPKTPAINEKRARLAKGETAIHAYTSHSANTARSAIGVHSFCIKRSMNFLLCSWVKKRQEREFSLRGNLPHRRGLLTRYRYFAVHVDYVPVPAGNPRSRDQLQAQNLALKSLTVSTLFPSDRSVLKRRFRSR